MATIHPLTLFYDGRCAVCTLEMDHLRERCREGQLVFVDIAAADFDAAQVDATPARLQAEIHGLRADGELIRGLQVLRLAYAAAGIGWVLAPTGWWPLRLLSDVAYRLFARHRRTISRAARPLIDLLRAARARRMVRRIRACHAGRCDINGRPS